MTTSASPTRPKARIAKTGQFVTSSGRVLMEPAPGSKLTARDIDRAIAKATKDSAPADKTKTKAS